MARVRAALSGDRESVEVVEPTQEPVSRRAPALVGLFSWSRNTSRDGTAFGGAVRGPRYMRVQVTVSVTVFAPLFPVATIVFVPLRSATLGQLKM